MKKYSIYFAIIACYISLFALSCKKEYDNPPSSTTSASTTAGTTTSSSTTSGTTTSSTTSGTTTSTTTTTGSTTSAPCSPTNNSYSGTNTVGSGGFSSITDQSFGGYYAVHADLGTYPTMQYMFLGANPPASGKYITSFLPSNSSQVAMQFFVSTSEIWQDMGGDTIYVTHSGNQVIITACGASLTNLSNFSSSIFDSKITKP